MNIIGEFFAKIGSWFHNPKVEAVFNSLATIVTVAEPIVADIAALTPNKTVQEITAAYTKYAVPVSLQITTDPTSTGNALLNLATAVVNKNLKNPAATSLVNTAVQIAVTAAKAGAVPTPTPVPGA